jgi:hypothetical protein
VQLHAASCIHRASQLASQGCWCWPTRVNHVHHLRMHRFELGNAGSRRCPTSSKRQSQFLVFEGVKRGLDNVVGDRDVGDQRKLMEGDRLVVAGSSCGEVRARSMNLLLLLPA